MLVVMTLLTRGYDADDAEIDEDQIEYASGDE